MTLMVSVSGVRGLVGRSLTPELVLEFAQAWATLRGGGRIVLARDSRNSGPMYAAAAEAGLLAAGCEVRRIGLAMTPTAGYVIREGGLDGGVVITASHNPAGWNGVKFLDERGMAPDAATAEQITALRAAGGLRTIHDGFQPVQADEQAGLRHVRAVLDAVEVDLTPLRGSRVVLDSVNGAGGPAAALLLREMGCEVIQLNGEPDGRFAHPPEPLAENLVSLCHAVREQRAGVGFAQDPDGDRLAVVDEYGQYIGEEYTLALAVESALSRRPGPVALNLSTSSLSEIIAARYNVPVFRTPVGESHVARAMLAHGCVIGGEGNGGVIDPRISLVRDSLSAMSLVLQLMAAADRPLSRLVAGLPRRAMLKRKYECDGERIAAAIERVAAAFAERQPDRRDGVWVRFEEGWVHLRASNTEPIVRIVAEAEEESAAAGLIGRVWAASGL
jgi:phosphomannomutase